MGTTRETKSTAKSKAAGTTARKKTAKKATKKVAAKSATEAKPTKAATRKKAATASTKVAKASARTTRAARAEEPRVRRSAKAATATAAEPAAKPVRARARAAAEATPPSSEAVARPPVRSTPAGPDAPSPSAPAPAPAATPSSAAPARDAREERRARLEERLAQRSAALREQQQSRHATQPALPLGGGAPQPGSAPARSGSSTGATISASTMAAPERTQRSSGDVAVAPLQRRPDLPFDPSDFASRGAHASQTGTDSAGAPAGSADAAEGIGDGSGRRRRRRRRRRRGGAAGEATAGAETSAAVQAAPRAPSPAPRLGGPPTSFEPDRSASPDGSFDEGGRRRRRRRRRRRGGGGPDDGPGAEAPPRHDARLEARHDARPEARHDARPEARHDARLEARHDARLEARHDARPEARHEARPEPAPSRSPWAEASDDFDDGGGRRSRRRRRRRERGAGGPIPWDAEHEAPAVNVLPDRDPFSELVSIDPEERIDLETDTDEMSMRVVDLITPIGKGQRALIVAPPKTGKTTLLMQLARAISLNHPEVELVVMLVDERPEEVTAFRRAGYGEVMASSNDEPTHRHLKLTQHVLDIAKRRVLDGKDVCILLDSITRMARAHNVASSGHKTLSGGLDSRALERPKRFFGAARKIANGGSLTILATALIDTGSRMDEVIFQEFKGTGNSELQLDRRLAERRIWPAIDIQKSGTRKEEKLFERDEFEGVVALRRALSGKPPAEAMQMLLSRLAQYRTNREFLLDVARKAATAL